MKKCVCVCVCVVMVLVEREAGYSKKNKYKFLIDTGNLNVHTCSIQFLIPFFPMLSFSCYFLSLFFYTFRYFNYFCHLTIQDHYSLSFSISLSFHWVSPKPILGSSSFLCQFDRNRLSFSLVKQRYRLDASQCGRPAGHFCDPHVQSTKRCVLGKGGQLALWNDPRTRNEKTWVLVLHNLMSLGFCLVFYYMTKLNMMIPKVTSISTRQKENLSTQNELWLKPLNHLVIESAWCLVTALSGPPLLETLYSFVNCDFRNLTCIVKLLHFLPVSFFWLVMIKWQQEQAKGPSIFLLTVCPLNSAPGEEEQRLKELISHLQFSSF